MIGKETADRLRKRARRAGVAIPPKLVSSLSAYLELLTRWNAKINLTSLEEPDRAIDRLLLEPLIAVKYLPAEIHRVIDIGSGGGSPAIPLKLASPMLHLTMVEAKTRKAAFLREAVRVLELSQSQVETSRYEELLTRPELHESADVVTIRAVRVEASTLLSLQAFLISGGRLFWFRGPGASDIPAVMPPPLVWEATHPLVESLRSRLVILRKSRVGITQAPGTGRGRA